MKFLFGLLDRRQLLSMFLLSLLLLISGVFELAAMVTFFMFLRGLVIDEATGLGGGRLFNLMTDLNGGVPLDVMSFSIIGGGIVIAAFIFKNVLSIGVEFSSLRFIMKCYARVQRRLLLGFLSNRYDLFKERGAFYPKQTLYEVYVLFSSGFAAMMRTFADLILICVVCGLLAFVDIGLLAVGVCIFATAGVGLYLLTRHSVGRMAAETQIAQRSGNQLLDESFGGLLDHRIPGRTDHLVSAFSKSLDRVTYITPWRGAVAAFPRTTNELLLAIAVVCAAIYFITSGNDLSEALPTLALFGFAGLRMTTAATRVSAAFQVLKEYSSQLDDLVGHLTELAPDVLDKTQAPRSLQDYRLADKPLPEGHPGHVQHKFGVRDAVYTYPNAEDPALKGVSVTIEKGSLTALCGPSGGGKTTLMLMLMGLLPPDDGEAFFDDLQMLNHISSWHKMIGYVGQRPFIANRTVRENIAFGMPVETIDDDIVWQALELARLDGFIKGLPKGLDTHMGEDGDLFSGGQRQRIAIARALYGDPEILFFDEATAALDNVTEFEISRAIEGLSGDKTVVVIAHRLSTIQEADVIHYLEDGKISESGSYKELLEKSSGFRRLARPDDEDGGNLAAE